MNLADITTLEEARRLIQELFSQVEALRAENAKLRADNERLRAENQELRTQLARLQGGGPTPSTPSGMIPPYKKPSLPKRRKRPGRKKGHKGAHRMVPDRVDKTQEHTLEHCPRCATGLGEHCSVRTRYTEDIPPQVIEVIKHIIYGYYCPTCKTIVESPVAEALPHSTLGLRLMVMTAWLHYELGVTVGKIRKWLSSICKFRVTKGGLTQVWARMAELLAPLYQGIQQEARTSAVLHADETGWRVNGKGFWLWCFTAKRLAYYVIDCSRGAQVVRRVLGKIFQGTLVVDFLGAYNKIVAWAKQRCLVHLFRALEVVQERNRSAEWEWFYKKLKRLLRDAIRLGKVRDKLGDKTYESRWLRLYSRLSELAERKYVDKDCRRLAKRLRRHWEELFVFLENAEVDPDNNHAERQMRQPVISRKNSYCNRSPRGAQTQAVLMSIFRTLELRQVDAVEHLIQSLKAQITTGSLLPLLAVGGPFTSDR